MTDDPRDWWSRAVDAILELHSERTFIGDGYGWSRCAEDQQAWPCKTVEKIMVEAPELAIGPLLHEHGSRRPR